MEMNDLLSVRSFTFTGESIPVTSTPPLSCCRPMLRGVLDNHRILFRFQKQIFIELLRRETERDRDSTIQCLCMDLAPCTLAAYSVTSLSDLIDSAIFFGCSGNSIFWVGECSVHNCGLLMDKGLDSLLDCL